MSDTHQTNRHVHPVGLFLMLVGFCLFLFQSHDLFSGYAWRAFIDYQMSVWKIVKIIQILVDIIFLQSEIISASGRYLG